MSLYVDKHRPKSLGQLSFHPELTERLTKMVSSGNFPHLLFYGPSGAGRIRSSLIEARFFYEFEIVVTSFHYNIVWRIALWFGEYYIACAIQCSCACG
jgi:replication-associated recombination protein RarA